MFAENPYIRVSYSFSPDREVGLRGVLFFLDVIKDFSSQSPSQLRWSLCKNCGLDDLHAKGSQAWRWELAPAQALHGSVTLTKVGSPLGGGRGGLIVSNNKMQKLSWWTVVGMSGMFIPPFHKGSLNTYCVPGPSLSPGVQWWANQTGVFAPWGLDFNRKEMFLK